MKKHPLLVLLAIVIIIIVPVTLRKRSAVEAAAHIGRFIESVNNNEEERWQKFWTEGSMSAIQDNYGISFNQFCKTRFACDSYSLSSMTKQKGAYYRIQFQGEIKGKITNYSFYLVRAGTGGDIWKLIEENVMKKN